MFKVDWICGANYGATQKSRKNVVVQNCSVSSTPDKPDSARVRNLCLGATGLGILGIAIVALRKHNTKELFPLDVEYRKSLLRDMNLPESECKKLRSIIGCEELRAVLKKLDKENFLPGVKSYRANQEVVFLGKENVASGKYAANLHTHTYYSDGKFSVAELLEQGAKYGDERVEKLGKDNPFYLAITDHDTVEGCKEAVNIIRENPEKYKNLRLVLGIENTAIADYSDFIYEPVQVHMLTLGINPFDKDLNAFLQKKISKNCQNIEKVLNVSNERYAQVLNNYGIKYNLNEFTQMVPALGCGIKSVGFYHKDYMQFRLIYAASVEKNHRLSQYLNSQHVNMNFITPIENIEAHPDYSRGQKYYEYYFDAIKSRIKSQIPEKDFRFVDEQLKKIPDEIIPTLYALESDIMLFSPKYTVPAAEFYTFEDIVKFYTEQKYGQMGIAHPGVVFPYKNLKDDENTFRFYDSLYRDFKALGGEKAVYAEDNYGVYYKQLENLHKKLEQLSDKYGLEQTGGLDTHIKDIFASK